MSIFISRFLLAVGVTVNELGAGNHSLNRLLRHRVALLIELSSGSIDAATERD
ncbi:hypothetical protein NBRC111894_712 [Sporolactobacillus inulinus]|uniref:Uncharacterized protein n=1 Tax=Sporolactobacillus inulinus TaxID=2078 RepID=A0A4Y1Z894_9BACL|nr:hypothetical protein NBRC111894_712 [Sporolactobacillus inulinus]